MYQGLKASPPANSKAIGAIFIGLKVFLSRVMSSQEEEADDRPLFLEGERGQQYFSFLTTTRFYDVKQTRNYSVLTSRSIAATN